VSSAVGDCAPDPAPGAEEEDGGLVLNLEELEVDQFFAVAEGAGLEILVFRLLQF
jgi:hypothetical protein